LQGTAAFLAQRGVGGLAPLGAQVTAWQTVVGVAVDGVFLGRLLLADRERPSARRRWALRALGVRLTMLTGDAPASPVPWRCAAGIDAVVAEQRPTKAADGRSVGGDGHRVAMVGDRINDAPALARADVGIAMGSGTDVAMQAADVTLMRGDLSMLVTAIRLSRRTLATMRQNLFWAFAYNVLAVPVAAGLLAPWGITLSPVVAGAAMALSSVTVVTNSLRLRHEDCTS
jgi:Cu+-exporting ATPase